MDYLNTNFTSIKDFDILDETMSKLESAKLEIASVVKQKVESNGEQQHQLQHGQSSESVVSSVAEHDDGVPDKIVAQLEEVCAGSNTVLLASLQSQYGNLTVFNDLSKLFEQKSEYVQILQVLGECKDLEENELKNLPTDGSSIEKYQAVFAAIPQSTPTLNQLSQSLLTQLNAKIYLAKNSLQYNLETILNSYHWLKKNSGQDGGIPPATLKAIQELIEKLMTLQSINHKPVYPDTWWAIDTLVKPFLTSFQYHFVDPKKPTNKIDKPEWCLDYMESYVKENLEYILLVIGTNIDQFRHRIVEYDILSSMLVPVRSKMIHSAKQINKVIEIQEQASNPNSQQQRGRALSQVEFDSDIGRLLSHLIYELSSFDQRIRNRYKYNPYIDNYLSFDLNIGGEWMGITGDIMLDPKLEFVATNWLSFESQLAKKRFHKGILNSENSFQIDFDFKENTTTTTIKPTYSAYNLTKLFENLTSHYETLNIVKYQLKYVHNIQLDIIELYCDELTKRFRSLNLKSVLEYIPGGIASKATSSKIISSSSGSGAGSEKGEDPFSILKSITSLYCSTKFIIEKMELWSEEFIFIKLFNEFQKENRITGSLEKDLTIFDDEVARYKKLASSLMQKFEVYFTKEVRSSMKKYVNDSKWDEENETIEEEMEVSNDLGTFAYVLPEYLRYLSKSLSSIDYYLVSRDVCSIVAKTFREFVITNNKFSVNGVKQLRLDFDYIFRIIGKLVYLEKDSYFDNSQNVEYLKANESIQLLELVKPHEVKAYGDYDAYPALRDRLDSRLHLLNDFEIFDLLHRINRT